MQFTWKDSYPVRGAGGSGALIFDWDWWHRGSGALIFDWDWWHRGSGVLIF